MSLYLLGCPTTTRPSEIDTVAPSTFYIVLMEHYVEPTYPNELLEAREGGIVVIEVALDDEGEVVETEVLEASNAAFAVSVEQAVRLSKFRALMPSEGVTVPSKGRLIYYFTPGADSPRVTLANDKSSRQSLLRALRDSGIDQ